MKTRFVLLMACFFLCAHSNAQVQTARYVSTSSNSNAFYEYLPQGYSGATETYPLIVFIHGMGELGDGSAYQLPKLLNHALPQVIQQGRFPLSFNTGGKAHKFIVLSPQFKQWPGAGDVDAVVEYALRTYRVDRSRIYVTGLSMGGGATWEYVGTPAYIAKVAAIVPVCGASWPDMGRARAIAAANLPVWATHNSGDGTVPAWYTTDYVKNINIAPAPNPPAKQTIWASTSHDAWTKTYDPNFRENGMNVYEWMLQYSKGAPAPPANIAPTVSAGADQTIVQPQSTVTLTGTGTDSDGSISSYQWSKVAGPAAHSFSSANAAGTSVSGLVPGRYRFRLQATDNGGATTGDEVIVTVAASLPGRIEAEAYTEMAGVQAEATGDAGGGQNIGYIANGDWMEYVAHLTSAGAYTLNLRLASAAAGGTIKVTGTDGATLATVSVPNTGGWQTYTTVATPVNLPAGVQTIRLQSTAAAGWNINWLEVAGVRALEPVAEPTGCAGRRFNITPWSDGGRYHTGKTGSSHTLGARPGDTLVISASYGQWSYLALEEFHGTPQCPIVIINEGGAVQMSKGIEIRHSTNLKITGSGSAAEYGFYMHNPGPDNGGVAVTVEGRSKNIEIERISVRKKTYGAWLKQDATCDESINYPNWRMDNISLHHSKFVNIGQDAIYAGTTDPLGTRPVTCNGVTTYPKAMRLSNFHLYNLIIDSCMRTAIQLSICDSGTNSIHDNIISRTGYELNQQQGTGISLGGMTRNTYVYNNRITSSYIYGILSVGAGTNYIENNIIDSSGWLDGKPNLISRPASIYIDTRPTLPFDSSRIIIRNNRIGINASAHGWDIFLEKSYDTYYTGNLICGNTKLDGKTPAVHYARPGVQWSDCLPVPSDNIPPVAIAGADQTFSLPQNNTTLYGSVMDRDGSITSTEWRWISGPSGSRLTGYNMPVSGLTGLTAGVYLFEFKVVDNRGAIGRDSVKITVLAANYNAPPTVNAGSDQTITLPTSETALQATAADSDGTIASVKWTQVSGPSAASLATADKPYTQVSGLIEGVYRFEFAATDNSGNTTKASVQVTVRAAAPPPPAPNAAPVTHAGADQEITLPASSVRLNGTATDSDGTIASLQWSQVSGPATAAIAQPAAASTDINGLREGTYTFRLVATDNAGATAADSMTVVVKPAVAPPPPPPAPNAVPTANAGPDQEITLPDNLVRLNGTGTDSDGNITAWQWAQVSGPSAATFAPANTASTEARGLQEGTYLFRLTVTDNQNATASDTVRVVVKAAPNRIPTANAGADQGITLPTSSATLSGSGSDADGTITAYSWTKVSGGNATFGSPSSATTTVTGLQEGTYVFRLTVTDNRGGTASDDVAVTVNAALPAPNVAPTANAGADQTVTLPLNTVQLSGTGTDPDGQITAYSWSKISGPTSFTLNPTNGAQASLSGLAEGTYVFELTVTDNKGATGSDRVTITVLPAPLPPNELPQVWAGRDTTMLLPQQSVLLAGTATDRDGTITAWRWRQLSGPTQATLKGSTTATVEASGLKEGVYEFELQVTDNRGGTSSDGVRVKVRHLPQSKASVFPNPATSTLNVQIDANTHQNMTPLVIYNTAGVAVHTESFMRTSNTQVHTVDISHLLPGIYMLEVWADINRKVSIKFMKQ